MTIYEPVDLAAAGVCESERERERQRERDQHYNFWLGTRQLGLGTIQAPIESRIGSHTLHPDVFEQSGREGCQNRHQLSAGRVEYV